MDLLIFSNTKAKTHRQNLPQDFNELLFLMRSILIKKKKNSILKQRFIQPTLSEGPPWEATRTVKDQYCTVDAKRDSHLNILLPVAGSTPPDVCKPNRPQAAASSVFAGRDFHAAGLRTKVIDSQYEPKRTELMNLVLQGFYVKRFLFFGGIELSLHLSTFYFKYVSHESSKIFPLI